MSSIRLPLINHFPLGSDLRLSMYRLGRNAVLNDPIFDFKSAQKDVEQKPQAFQKFNEVLDVYHSSTDKPRVEHKYRKEWASVITSDYEKYSPGIEKKVKQWNLNLKKEFGSSQIPVNDYIYSRSIIAHRRDYCKKFTNAGIDRLINEENNRLKGIHTSTQNIIDIRSMAYIKQQEFWGEAKLDSSDFTHLKKLTAQSTSSDLMPDMIARKKRIFTSIYKPVYMRDLSAFNEKASQEESFKLDTTFSMNELFEKGERMVQTLPYEKLRTLKKDSMYDSDDPLHGHFGSLKKSQSWTLSVKERLSDIFSGKKLNPSLISRESTS